MKVEVPVMYALAERDWLWTVSEQHVRDFSRLSRRRAGVCGHALFEKAFGTKVEVGIWVRWHSTPV